mgnify:CR=1 FL=1
MKHILFFFFLLNLTSCEFNFFGVDNTFGKQHFISAISHIELHKLRNNSYPKKLEDLQFQGEWDSLWMNSVRYEKTNNGYNLFIERGWVGKPTLSFPKNFKKGLGLKKTNVIWTTPL